MTNGIVATALVLLGLLATGAQGAQDGTPASGAPAVPGVTPMVSSAPDADPEKAASPAAAAAFSVDGLKIGGVPACVPSCGLRAWGSAEYLLLWVRSAPLPPLASTGDPALAAAAGLPVGALGTPGTVILSPGAQSFGPLSGGRLTVGRWLDRDELFGVEASGFLTESRTGGFAIRSDANGNPFLGIPAIATPPQTPANQEAAQPFGVPGASSGSITATSSLRLWGAEANGVLNMWNTDRMRLNVLAGFRYIDLTEQLDMTDTTTILPAATTTFVFRDQFAARNQMFTGQIGARAEMTFGRWFVDLTTKVALGANHEIIDINGTAAILTAPGPFPFAPPVQPVNAGGFFAQKTNIGQRTRDEFVVIPEVRLQFGLNLTNNIRLFTGYEYLYMSRVVRPGDQIDRTVNGSQAFGGALTGQARPSPLFNSNDFGAYGFSAGLQFKW